MMPLLNHSLTSFYELLKQDPCRSADGTVLKLY